MLLALLGCAHIGYLDGAQVLPVGGNEYSFDLAYARDPNALSTVTGEALPSAGFRWRGSVAPGLDAGVHVYTFGIGTDLRFQLFDGARFDLAVQPQLDGFFLPIPGSDFGVVDLSFPVRGEYELSPLVSVIGGPAVLIRQGWFVAESQGLRTRSDAADLFLGGGTGVLLRLSTIRLGLTGSLYGDFSRATGLYGGISVHLARVLRPQKALPTGPGPD